MMVLRAQLLATKLPDRARVSKCDEFKSEGHVSHVYDVYV
jgi:hypothetical protein